MSYPFGHGIRLPDSCRGDRSIAVVSKGHFTGHIVVGDDHGLVIETESYLELNWSHCLIARANTASIMGQVQFDWYDGNGEIHEHFFDFVVTQTDGKRIAYTVKPVHYTAGEFALVMPHIADQARKSGFVTDVRLLTDEDLDPIELHNARLLHGVRHSDPVADDTAAEVFKGMAGIATLADLTDRVGLGATGFRALLRLVRAHNLQMVHHERIEPSSQVFKGKMI